MLVVAVTVNRKGSRRGRRQYIETEWPREFLCRLCLCYCVCTYFNRGRRWYMVTAWPRLFCVCLCLGLSLSVFVFVCVCLCLFFVFVSISIVVIGGEGGILLQRDFVCFVCVCHCLCLCLSLSVFSLCTYFNSCDWGDQEGSILLQRDLTKAVSRRPHRHTSRKKGKARQQKKIRERKCEEKHH